MLPFIQELFGNYSTLSNKIDNFRERGLGLQGRMTHYMKEYNGRKCHYFKPHIVSLKSKNLLAHINFLTNIEDKLESLKQYNIILERVCTFLYAKYDPHMIYTFNNEIHIVFYHNDEGRFIYDGDIMKTVTNIVSYASICITQELKNAGVNIDGVFEGCFVEFGKEYELLNYIVWRQLDCKRNNISLLYKCINYEGTYSVNKVDKVPLIELEKEVSKKVSCNVYEQLIYGIILKKKNVFTETKSNFYKLCLKDDENDEESELLLCRKSMTVQHIPLWVNFRSNFHKYVINKLL